MDINQELFNEISKYDVKNLKVKELNELAAKIREYIIKECSLNGGHLASNLGVIELTIALHKAFDLPKDKLLFDVGHQCYTHKILSGRSLENLRKENGVDGFQKRNESPYDPYEAGHSSTSISSAMGMALARDKNNENYHIVSIIGDASIANGMAFEALNNNDNFNHKVIIVVNDNNMSITESVGAFHSMLQNIRLSPRYMRMKDKYRNFMNKNAFTQALFSFTKKIKDGITHLIFRDNLFEMFGYHYIGDVDGYDFKELENAFKKAKKKKRSVVIHVTTIKGKGYNLSETSNVSSWHSVSPFDINSGKPLNTADNTKIKIRDVYARELEKELKENKDAIVINPGTSIGSGINNLMSDYPNQAFDVGISEEHAITFASGYALAGKHAYVSMYSTFLQRGYDQINHDIARMNLPVTLLIDHAGLIGSDGETHQGIFDESFLINMPNMTVCMAKDESEAISLFNFSKNYQKPLAIRYPVGDFDKKDVKLIDIQPGKWIYEKISDNKNLCVIAFGPKLNQITKEFNDITIVNALFQSPIDIELLKELLVYKNIIIYNPYGLEQGFAYHVNAKLNDLGYQNKIHRISVKNEFIQKGTIEEQEKRCQVDFSTLASLINSLK